MPKKLKDDAIIEAVCQIAFASTDLPEVIIGRLTDFPGSKDFVQKTNPVSNIPAPLRRADPQLRKQPLMQFSHRDGRVVAIGECVLSAHVVGVGAYPGWASFRSHVHSVVSQLFEKVNLPLVEGLTLRYINALVSSRHHVRGPTDLAVEISIGGVRAGGPINLNTVEYPTADLAVTTRIADTSFVQGTLPEGTGAVVDVEVGTRDGQPTPGSADAVMQWFDKAHLAEKRAFFRLLPPTVLAQLRED